MILVHENHRDKRRFKRENAESPTSSVKRRRIITKVGEERIT